MLFLFVLMNRFMYIKGIDRDAGSRQRRGITIRTGGFFQYINTLKLLNAQLYLSDIVGRV